MQFSNEFPFFFHIFKYKLHYKYFYSFRRIKMIYFLFLEKQNKTKSQVYIYIAYKTLSHIFILNILYILKGYILWKKNRKRKIRVYGNKLVYKWNLTPIKPTPFVSFYSIVMYPFIVDRVGHYKGIVLIPQFLLFFFIHSIHCVTPGRCYVAAIFHYWDNLIHIFEWTFVTSPKLYSYKHR